MNRKNKKRYGLLQIFLYLYMLIILFSLLTVASYTWFSLSRTPRVSDLYLFVNAASGLELSLKPDAEEWEMQLDFRDMVDVTTDLRPVTWSEKDQKFYAAEYGADGRRTDRWLALTDEINANKNNIHGYYIKASFFARTGQRTQISLSPAVEVEEGLQGSGTYLIGYPEWEEKEIIHSDGGKGAQCAVRIGIRITPVDTTGTPTGEPGTFFIYEPNSNMHLSDATEYIPTPSIDGTTTLVPEERLILQSASTWTEAYPVERNVVIHELGEFTTESKLWILDQNELIRIDLYIWLEGQDMDCTNVIERAQILASIQFAGESTGQSGMDPIE